MSAHTNDNNTNNLKLKVTRADDKLAISTSISLDGNIDLDDEDELREVPARRKRNSITVKDFICSFEEKFFAIYNKFDQLLNQQESSLDKSSSSSFQRLNEQKAQFIDETAKELNENVDLDTISSDPEMIQKFKNIYELIQSQKANKNELENNKKTNK